ncbi:MAG: GMC family oxidoreductase [Deltaproteobacteria bacterium]|nr:GMC family oxidoreductase [Deltaproteobacteria bacterium]
MSTKNIQPGILEGQTVEKGLALSCDVCVVGSGAGGGTTAAVLAKAGLHVIVVEEGGYFTQNRFRMLEAESFPNLYQEGGQRTTKDLSAAIYQGRSVGGGTTVNWTTCFHLPEETLEHWSKKRGVRSLTNDALAPHYKAMEKRLGIHKVDLAQVNKNNRLLYDGCKKLGWKVDTLKRNVRGCAQTGYCGLGCPIDAKQSTLITTLPDAMNHGATVISRCRVEKLHQEGSHIRSLSAVFLDAFGRKETGVKVDIKAKKFILSAGSIGSPSILLKSGISSGSGLTGKRTFLHPVIGCGAIFDEEVHGYHGAPQGAASHHFAHRGDEMGYFMEVVPLQPLFVSGGIGGFGKTHFDTMQQLPNLQVSIAIGIDGLHDFQGGEVGIDKDGNPQLDYQFSEHHFKAFRHATKSLSRVQLAAGAKEVLTLHDPAGKIYKESDVDTVIDALPFAANQIYIGSAHQMGGLPMSDEKEKGVVRAEDLRHFDVDNLHVFDGSVFPTSLGVNPQLSIYGLTHLMASRLATSWK